MEENNNVLEVGAVETPVVEATSPVEAPVEAESIIAPAEAEIASEAIVEAIPEVVEVIHETADGEVIVDDE